MRRRSEGDATAAAAPRSRVLIAEPHDGFRRALCDHLEAQYEIVAAVADGAALRREARAGSPNVIVCDLSLLSSAEEWTRLAGRRGWVSAIVVLSLHDEPALARRLRHRDLAACVPKWAAASELNSAIHRALPAGRS